MTIELAEVTDTVGGLETSFDELTGELDEIIGSNDNGTDIGGSEFDELKERVGVLETNFEELSANFNDLVDELDEIIGHDNDTDAELDILKEQVDGLQANVDDLDTLG